MPLVDEGVLIRLKGVMQRISFDEAMHRPIEWCAIA
jgi:hypothetical protein